MLGSSNLIAVDAGEFSVKTLSGKWQNASNFSGQTGDLTEVSRGEGINKNEAAAFAIRQSLKPLKINNMKAYTAIPLSDVILREITIDKSLDPEGALEVELSNSLPFSLDQVYFDFTKLASGEEDKYLVAASRRDVVDPLTEKLRGLNKKIQDVSVDIDAFAFGRLLGHTHPDALRSDKVLVLVDIGHRHTRFYFYDSSGLLYNREQQIGGFQVTESVAEVYDLDIEEAQNVKADKAIDSDFRKLVTIPYVRAFAEQLNLVLDFYEASGKSHKPIDSIVFVGGGSCLEGFISELGVHVDYPISILDLSSIWRKKAKGEPNWFSFCANYALSVALLAEGVQL